LINFNEKFHELGVPDNPGFSINDIGVREFVAELFRPEREAAHQREKEREQQQLQQKSNKREVSL